MSEKKYHIDIEWMLNTEYDDWRTIEAYNKTTEDEYYSKLVEARDQAIHNKQLYENEKIDLLGRISGLSIQELKEQAQEEYIILDEVINKYNLVIDKIQKEIDHNYEVKRLIKNKEILNIVEAINKTNKTDICEFIEKNRLLIYSYNDRDLRTPLLDFDKRHEKDLCLLMRALGKTLLIKDLEELTLHKINDKPGNEEYVVYVKCMSKYLSQPEYYKNYNYVA
jgi:hypothetical protein